jgi:uncharacterized protein YcbK (DUF882 family)
VRHIWSLRLTRGLGSFSLASLFASSAIAVAAPNRPVTPPRTPQKSARHIVARVSQHNSAYSQYVRAWHTPSAERAAPTDPAGRAHLVLYSINTGDSVSLAPATERGGFSASDLDRAAFVLREQASGNQHPVEPRLLDAAYRLQTRFRAQEIRVLSGYRTPHGRGSNHSAGRALDIVVPGASDADVAEFARGLGFLGVGIYPTSGFVHIDVRARSYFWVDTSGAGRRNRERGILGDLAQRSDAQALARGERSVSPFFIATDVDAALRLRDKGAMPGAAPVLEDDTDLDADSESAESGIRAGD